MTTRLRLQFDADLDVVQSKTFHALTPNGPFVDAHFRQITEATPIGETYYMRPLSVITPPCIEGKVEGCGCGGRGGGALSIRLDRRAPFVRFDDNTVVGDVTAHGTIQISPFTWGTLIPTQRLAVDVTLTHPSNKPLLGLHVHDGRKCTAEGACKGFTSFGPISYFLLSSEAW